MIIRSQSVPPEMAGIAFNPVFYYTQLTEIKNCPGFEQYDDCKYRTPKRTGDAAQYTSNWTCEAGNFCQSSTLKVPCDPGFLCIKDSVEPVICPSRYYCSNPTSVIRCPEGFYCPYGSISPYSCLFGYCPAGSETHTRWGVFGVFLAARWELMVMSDTNDRMEELPKMEKLTNTFDIKFENMGLRFRNGTEIMHNVSGEFKHGRLCAIMGPSGTGKTTFINLLTGKTKRTSGKIFVNGKRSELSYYKKLIGFVPQEDIMLRELTVMDILSHSAKMRLPSNWKHDRVKDKVNEIVNSLGLNKVIDSAIGYEGNRGISGGQRKRVNIGMELVAEPSIIFLDEPTSGLDSTMALDVCEKLRNITIQQGLTVAAVIHSPSVCIFNQFDDFMLLGKGGRVIYFGETGKTLEYFNSIGFTCSRDTTPSDFFLNVASGKEKNQLDPNFTIEQLPIYWEQHLKGIQPVKQQSFTNNCVINMENSDPTVMGSNSENLTQTADGTSTILNDSQTNAEHHQNNLISPKKNSNATTNELQIPHSESNHRASQADLKERFTQENQNRIKNERSFGKKCFLGVLGLISGFFFWLGDIVKEIWSNFTSCILFIFCQNDPVRDNAGIFKQFWLLTKRSFLQIFRSSKSFIIDQLLHFCVGLFISIAIQHFEFVGRFPDSICVAVPMNLMGACAFSVDELRQSGMFISLGVLFAGISVGTQTFGNEKNVYFRDTSSGMSTIAYYLGKFILDVPRMLLAGVVYSMALTVFWPYKQSFYLLLLIVELLYFVAFPMGYFISWTVKKSSVPLAGVGFALLWAIVLNGITPSLTDLSKSTIAKSYFYWLWIISAPRQAIEAFWLNETKARGFLLPKTAPNTYVYGEQDFNYLMIFFIQVGWNVLSFLCLKLLYRRQQK
ncbi:hypothetical protein HK099_005623 [Clydaea vesicula]|uniref:ABC transporter domain-containing protein n=1 Tax=Clydaea vesicula TaxID=447962 RepID=A0AAD5TZ75_9FUNG|nr:hypothetical protein HK099_005623 [Clydaea vesicula]